VKHFLDTISSKSYWQYVLFSRVGAESVLAIFGSIYLLVEALDFFGIYARDRYASYAFLIFLVLAVVISVLFFRRPIKSISIRLSQHDLCIEARIADLFDARGAIMISTNTIFEADVAAGKIAPDSLQGQFTARYFTGNQDELVAQIKRETDALGGSRPFPIGATIPITTHGKTFYFTAMAELNEQGNASTTPSSVGRALEGLWKHVRETGELQELAVPVIGTGRGRVRPTRKKMIALIAESFMKASEESKFTNRLVIVIRPEDATSFGLNLYDVKDHLNQILHA
jgi:hypothetical protein